MTCLMLKRGYVPFASAMTLRWMLAKMVKALEIQPNGLGVTVIGGITNCVLALLLWMRLSRANC